MEHIGSGIQRMRTTLNAYGLKEPVIEADSGLFSVTFYRKGVHEAIVKNGVIPSLEGLNEGLNEGLKLLYMAIRDNHGLQTKALSERLDNRSIKTLERQIRNLKDLDLIEYRGSRKAGGYWIKENN